MNEEVKKTLLDNAGIRAEIKGISSQFHDETNWTLRALGYAAGVSCFAGAVAGSTAGVAAGVAILPLALKGCATLSAGFTAASIVPAIGFGLDAESDLPRYITGKLREYSQERYQELEQAGLQPQAIQDIIKSELSEANTWLANNKKRLIDQEHYGWKEAEDIPDNTPFIGAKL